MATFEDLARGINRTANELHTRAVSAVRELTTDGLEKVRDNASGRPGPERVTGEYVNAMTSRVSVSGGIVEGGTDSLGRQVSAPPYPHWRPTAEWLEDRIPDVLGDAVAKAVG
jgi:hypothetical protein